MKYYITRLILAIVILGSILSAADSPEDTARAWLKAREQSGLVLVYQSDTEGFSAHPVAGLKSYRYELNHDGYWVSLGFSGEIKKDMDLQTVRGMLKYAAVNQLPTPGLKAPANWEIKPRTPVSSFKDGVEILDVRDGHIVFRIRTEFFALSGRDTSILVPADAGMPPGSYFQIRQKFKLDLTVSCPIPVS